MHSTKWTVSAIAAIVAVITGCGGGSSGVRPESYPTPVVGAGAGVERANPYAHDLGEHWRAPQTLTRSLGATDPAGGTVGLSTALDAAGERTSRASSMRSINASDMTPIGSRDGITVGRWTSGPADTLDIDFYYNPNASLSAADRARIERAGKAWSRHIRTDFEAHTVTAGTETGWPGLIQYTTIETDTAVDDMLITVTTTSQGEFSRGGATGSTVTNGVVRPGVSFIQINTGDGHHRDNSVIAHEIGHAIFSTEPTLEGVQLSTTDRYLSEDGYHFEGPATMRANQGEPVPFQWIDSDNERVKPGTLGAMVDYGHPDVCTSIMAYCAGNDIQTPAAIDLAWLEDMGYDIDSSANALAAEVYGYGAWGTYSAWGVGVARHLSGFEAGEDWLEASADAFGVAPARHPRGCCCGGYARGKRDLARRPPRGRHRHQRLRPGVG